MKRLILVGAALAALLAGPASAQDKILNASYDVARELFARVNAAFIPKYKAETGKDVTIDQSHAGTSKQARAILEGLEADVVTFNQVTDIEFLVEERLRLRRTGRSEFPNNASPYYSLPSFLVRAGNPKGIKDWDDLVRDDVKVDLPEPEDLRQRPLHLSRRHRLRQGSVQRRRGQGRRRSSRSCSTTCRCSTPAAAPPPPPSSSARSATC